MKIKNLTEPQAIEQGLTREIDLNVKTSHCPTCGCPWSGNVNTRGLGYRVCGDCYQDWCIDVDYGELHELRELPGHLTIDECIEYLQENVTKLNHKQIISVDNIAKKWVQLDGRINKEY